MEREVGVGPSMKDPQQDNELKKLALGEQPEEEKATSVKASEVCFGVTFRNRR